ncbi:MAG: hypothetical protein ACI9OJ_003828 [Myxococcota bacterium]|jgi:hypothetical protein
MNQVFVMSLIFASVIGCKKDAPTPEPAADKPESPAVPSSDHGSETRLGEVTLAGFTLDVSALGTIAPGKDAAVAISAIASPSGKDWKTLNIYVWVEDAAGTKISAPEKGRIEAGRLHAHASVAAGTPAKLVLRLRSGSIDERASLALSGSVGTGKGAKHAHEKTPHDGIRVSMSAAGSEAPTGWLELKLHDDKGDLELWLTSDKAGAKPFDLPFDAMITVSFIDLDNRKVSLKPRNRVGNEDEDGKPNVRGTKTQYFIFPGETGSDAKWLLGKTFQSLVVVNIRSADVALQSEEFVLKPHTHAPGTAPH